MKRVVIDRPGGYRRLRLEECPDPVPGPGEVVIAVEAAGVNFADCIIRMGLYASAREYAGYPITPGFEVAGQVASLGGGVEDLRVGDPVIGVTRFNGYATRVRVPRAQVFARPAVMSVEEAAGFPTVFLTAWFALFELAHVRRGDRLLVHAAAGGVGGALVQLGRNRACETTGVVGAAHKVQLVRELGATNVIDRSSEDLWQAAERYAPGGFDVVCDANGVVTLRGSYDHLAPTGRLVVYGFHSMFPRRGGRPAWPRLVFDYLRTPRFNPFRMTQQNRNVMAFNLSYLFDRADFLRTAMDRLLEWVHEGALRVHGVSTYPMERVADAHRDLESGQTTGKLILRP